jgi:subtilisin family serine protease
VTRFRKSRRGGRVRRFAQFAIAAAPFFFGTLAAEGMASRQATRHPAADPPICVTIDPVFAVGCGGSTASPPPSSGGSTASQPSSSGGSTASPPSSSGRATAQSEPPLSATSVERSSTKIDYDPRRLAVIASPRASARALRSLFAQAGVSVERVVPQTGSYTLRVAPDRQPAALSVLRSSPLLARSGRDVISHALDLTPNDSEWAFQTGLRVVGFPRAWDITRGSPSVIVAVADTGVDPNQPDLRGALVPGANFVDPGAAPRDDHGHGTAVAAIIGARTENRQGIAGICWLCSVMPIKVLDKNGSGDDSEIGAGIVWAADHGARVINLSLGGPGDSPELAAAIAYATAKGAIVIAAAGNGSTDAQFFPAADPNALSVAGTTTTDHAYSWSNFGSWVDVAAPGCNVAPILGGGYGTFCGTSSATPLVAGLAALALSARASATAAETQQAIEQTATPVPGFVRFGRVNAADALGALLSGTSAVLVRNGGLDALHRTRSYVVQAVPGPFTATAEFAQERRLTLTLVSLKDGAFLGRVAGSSPLQLKQTVTGPVKLIVASADRRRLPFRLTISFSR